MPQGHDAAPDPDRDVASKNRRRALKRLLDLLGYTVIGVCLVGAAIFYASTHRSDPAPDARWLGLAGMTALTFGYPLKWYRSYWRKRLFWCTLVLLLFIHLAAYIEVLRSVDHFGLLWFAIVTPAEWSVMGPVLEWAGKKASKR